LDKAEAGKRKKAKEKRGAELTQFLSPFFGFFRFFRLYSLFFRLFLSEKQDVVPLPYGEGNEDTARQGISGFPEADSLFTFQI
jgi:hypothetical protein